MNQYTPTNPPNSGRAKRIWDRLHLCGMKLIDLHYNSNLWGRGQNQGYGTWAAQESGKRHGFWCGEDAGGVYVQNMTGGFVKVYPSRPCQMTMENNSPLGTTYFECGKPAKFVLIDRIRGPIAVCGIHARNKRGKLTPLTPPASQTETEEM